MSSFTEGFGSLQKPSGDLWKIVRRNYSVMNNKVLIVPPSELHEIVVKQYTIIFLTTIKRL